MLGSVLNCHMSLNVVRAVLRMEMTSRGLVRVGLSISERQNRLYGKLRATNH
jgi:hypothetical protein